MSLAPDAVVMISCSKLFALLVLAIELLLLPMGATLPRAGEGANSPSGSPRDIWRSMTITSTVTPSATAVSLGSR